ncbi:MAG: UTP--glucose-1-phosphate uridylyltransferase [Chlamydiales bacterium]|nr:UTP--glucose-1-phosphate uridylyltransferase [Chlamydiales bacterium]
MFKKILRLFLPNPFDQMLKKLSCSPSRRVLLAWNRGLGDIALGLYAMVQRIRHYVPDADITFLIRENLQDGFSLLEGVQTIVAPSWRRGEPYNVSETLKQLKRDSKEFDLVIDRPSPTDWVRWQHGVVVPRLQWKEEADGLFESFGLSQDIDYIGVQISAETSYGLWRNWPEEKWRELLRLLPSSSKMILFGFDKTPGWDDPRVVDLRGKTSLFEMMSIIKRRCRALVVPDSGILSMMYYLDSPFPLQVISLWADSNHGILKQGVCSPNPLLVHTPVIAADKDLRSLSPKLVYERLFPSARSFTPFRNVSFPGPQIPLPKRKIGCVILAGGQGTRLGFSGPKGLFSILGKTLFERIVEKIPDHVPIAVMTSPENHKETVQYFAQYQHGGKNITCFQQSTLPLLDENKLPCGIEGADGNGSFYRSFVAANLLGAWERQGVSEISLIPVDNCLADPLDPTFLSLHESSSAEVTIRCIERSCPEEAMGVLIERQGKTEVLEYCEAPADLFRKVQENKKLDFLYAYTGLVLLKTSFIKRVASLDLPLHWVQKTTFHQGREVHFWKGEKFLFDAFAFSRSTAVLCSARQECYAPLKAKEGPNGIIAVEKALCQ